MVSLRWIFACIDKVIYEFMSNIYNLIENLAKVNLFTDESLSEFTTRIYTILGIFMLFKISFSFISYLVDPDKFMDKKTGFSKMIVNIIVTFILLISAPWAFSILSDVQKTILDENILSSFILGNQYDNTKENIKVMKWNENCDGSIKTNNTGDYLALMVLRPFFQYNNSLTDEEKSDGVLCKTNDFNESYSPSSILVFQRVLAPQGVSGGVAIAAISVAELLSASLGSAVTGISSLFGADMTYQVNYMFFVSTIVGILVCGLLISFALDIAVRAIKMGFLQLIAPIPIISYIDPDKSKSKMFMNWLKEIGKTWMSLFIRLGALYLCLYILELLDKSNISERFSFWSWISLFMIVGALIFAKKLPSWLESLTGIKFDGGFEINPLKKIKNEALGGRQAVNGMMGLAGAGVGLVGSTAAHGIALYSNRKKFNTENTKLNDMKNDARISRIENNKRWRGLLDERRNLVQQKQRKSNLKNEMSSISGRIDALTASGRGNSALVDNLRRQYNSKASEFNILRDISDSEIQSKTAAVNDARRTVLASKRIAQEKIAEQQTKVDKINNEKIYKNPVASAAGEIARGAYRGARNAYNADTLNVGKVVSSGLKGVDEAALKRIYREDFSIQDELHDKITSFAHVKNDSGTSSEIAKELKANMDRLDNLTSALNTLESRLGNLPNSYSGAKLSEINNLVIQREKILERYTDADDYLRKNQGSALSKADLDVVFDTVNELVSETKERKQLTKRNKELDDMLKQQSKKE